MFGKVDAETHSQLAAIFRVMSLLTLVIIKRLRSLARSGTLSLEDLEDLVGQGTALTSTRYAKNEAQATERPRTENLRILRATTRPRVA